MASSPLRVAVDATSTLGVPTGVARVTTGLLEHLVPRADLDLIAYAVTWRGRDRLGRLVPPGVRPATRPFPARLTRVLWPRVEWPRVESWTGPVDVVHATSYVAPPARAPMLVSVYDLSYLHFREDCSGDALRYPVLVQVAIDRGATVHTLSDFVAAEIRDHYRLDDDRVVRVVAGLGPTPKGVAARGRALAGANRYVLAVGTLEPRKNLPVLVGAFDHVAATDADVQLVVAGPDGWAMEPFTDAVGRAHHRDRIRRLGWVDHQARDDLVAGATVLAYPSTYEGFGFPPLEAMQAGVPVVASNAGALPEVLGDAAVLADPGDVDAVAAGLARVLDDDDLRAGLIRRGTERVGRYRWDDAVPDYVRLYERLAGR